MAKRSIQADPVYVQDTEMQKDELYQIASDMTPAQGADWVEANVNDMAGVKRVLKALVKIVIVLVRKQRKREANGSL